MFERRAIMFDLGDNSTLSSRKILRLSDVFVSHMHMDHFIGFDRLLRLNLGRDNSLRMYGPTGIVEAVEHKLSSYSWNLVGNYKDIFEVTVTEVLSPTKVHVVGFRSNTKFEKTDLGIRRIEDGLLLDEPSFQVKTQVLDHGLSILAFAIEEKSHINIIKTRLEELGLVVGPWLNKLKTAIHNREPEETLIIVDDEKTFSLGYLKDRITLDRPGRKISYVVDIAYSLENQAKVKMLVSDSTDLFIEAPFLDVDAEQAKDRNHLTARQAGTIAREANVQRLTTFHYSPRYENNGDKLKEEADTAFNLEKTRPIKETRPHGPR